MAIEKGLGKEKASRRNLAMATISSSVTIGDEALEGCCGLTNFTIPSTVTSIGGEAFGVCSGLTTAVFLGDAQAWF